MLLRRRIQEVVAAQATSLGVSAEVDYQDGYPVLVNTPEETAFAARIGTELLGSRQGADRPAGGDGQRGLRLHARAAPGLLPVPGQRRRRGLVHGAQPGLRLQRRGHGNRCSVLVAAGRSASWCKVALGPRPDKETDHGQDATPERDRQRLPAPGNRRDADACRLAAPLPAARRLQGQLVRGRQGAPGQAPAPGAGVHAQAGEHALRPGQPGVDRGRRHRPRLPHTPHRAAQARHAGAAGSAGRAAAFQPARPQPPAVGVLRHRGPGRRHDGLLHQGAPCGHRRPGRRGAGQRHARHHADTARRQVAARAPPATSTSWAWPSCWARPPPTRCARCA